MDPMEKLQHMEDLLMARIALLREQDKGVPTHFCIWLSLIADAMNQHQKIKANRPLIG